MAADARHWRRIAKGALASVCYPVAALALRKIQPFVVSYHRVVEDYATASAAALPGMLVSRRMFEHHLDWLGRNYRFVTLDEIGARLQSGEPFEDPVAAITFDDGYRDVYEHACPVLARKGIPAAFFVVTELVGQVSWQIFDKLYYLLQRRFAAGDQTTNSLSRVLASLGIGEAKVRELMTSGTAEATTARVLTQVGQADILRIIEALEASLEQEAVTIPLPLTWEMVQTMRRAGFTIGSHTKTHVWLARESPERAADELIGAKQTLERRLREPIVHFAYPGGQFTTDVVKATADAGYRFGYTLCRHRDAVHPLLSIPRELLWENSAIDAGGRFAPAVMACRTRGLFSAANQCTEAHG